MKGQRRAPLTADHDPAISAWSGTITYDYPGAPQPALPPPDAEETILLEATPRPEPQPDIPLADLTAWVDARINEVADEIEADLARYDDWIATLLHDLDQHAAAEKQHADNYTAEWQQHIDARCASSMTDPGTKPTPKASAA